MFKNGQKLSVRQKNGHNFVLFHPISTNLLSKMIYYYQDESIGEKKTIILYLSVQSCFFGQKIDAVQQIGRAMLQLQLVFGKIH